VASVSHAVDQESARAAYTLPTVMFEGNRRHLLTEEVLVDGVEHFKE
jgi:hypothetical protein